MKTTGCAQGIDQNGRVVIPKNLRSSLNIEVNDVVEFFINENKELVMRKSIPKCVFCGTTEGLLSFKDKKICSKCFNDLFSSNDKK